MKLGVDIDGLLCVEAKVEGRPDYASSVPLPEGIALVRELRARGHQIVLHTARWEEDREVTQAWLYEQGVDFDELVMGKPKCDKYLDDRAMRFVPSLTADEVEED